MQAAKDSCIKALIEKIANLKNEQDKFYVVEKSQVSEAALKYLQSFAKGGDLILHDELSAIDEQSAEIRNLKALVADLRQDRVQL